MECSGDFCNPDRRECLHTEDIEKGRCARMPECGHCSSNSVCSLLRLSGLGRIDCKPHLRVMCSSGKDAVSYLTSHGSWSSRQEWPPLSTFYVLGPRAVGVLSTGKKGRGGRRHSVTLRAERIQRRGSSVKTASLFILTPCHAYIPSMHCVCVSGCGTPCGSRP